MVVNKEEGNEIEISYVVYRCPNCEWIVEYDDPSGMPACEECGNEQLDFVDEY